MIDLFATISAIYDDGIGLIFDGQVEPSKKHYRCNSSAVFSVGQRVKLVKASGTYVVEYPVGAPSAARLTPDERQAIIDEILSAMDGAR
jgi:hypothetical protein